MNVVAPARTSVAVVVLWEVRALPGEWLGIWLRKDITYHPSRDRLAGRPAPPRPGDRPGEHAWRIGRTRGRSDGPVFEHPDGGLGWRPVPVAQPRNLVGGLLHRGGRGKRLRRHPHEGHVPRRDSVAEQLGPDATPV